MSSAGSSKRRFAIQFSEAARLLGSISNEDFDQLCATLQKVPLHCETKQIQAALLKEVSWLKSEDAKSLVDLLMFLNLNTKSPGPSYEYFVDSIVKDYQLEDNATNEQVSHVRNRTDKLFEMESAVKIQAKAIEIMSGQERLLREMRIFSDIRPVFPSNDSVTEPVGAVVMHTLRLQFYENDSVQSFHVCMDDGDLDAFIKQLDRAKKKSTELSQILQKANVPKLRQ